MGRRKKVEATHDVEGAVEAFLSQLTIDYGGDKLVCSIMPRMGETYSFKGVEQTFTFTDEVLDLMIESGRVHVERRDEKGAWLTGIPDKN